jgi:D-amino-acid dehydrogenase
MKRKHVLIIGAGIAGISAAYYLNKAGMDVTVIDKNSGLDNCSYGNAGMIVPSHIIPLASPGTISKGLRWMLKAESPFYIKPRLSRELLDWGWKFKKSSTNQHVLESGPVLKEMLLQSRELLIKLEDEETLDFDYQKQGLFMFCNTQNGLDNEVAVAEKAQKLGIPAEVFTPGEVREKEPNLKIDILGATYFPLDAHLHPGFLMNGLKSLLKSRGVGFMYYTEIKNFHIENGRIMAARSSDGLTWKADRFVICTGAWSSAVARKAGINLPMQAGKGYSITLTDPPHLPVNCGIFAEAKVTMTPMNRLLRFGGTMEIAGTSMHVNPKKLACLKKSVCQYLPQFTMNDLQTEKPWVGLRPCSPDGLPYVGAIKKFENLSTSVFLFWSH